MSCRFQPYSGTGESLKNYLERYNAAVAEVGNPKDDAILMALTRGVDPDLEFGGWLAKAFSYIGQLFLEGVSISEEAGGAMGKIKRHGE